MFKEHRNERVLFQLNVLSLCRDTSSSPLPLSMAVGGRRPQRDVVCVTQMTCFAGVQRVHLYFTSISCTYNVIHRTHACHIALFIATHLAETLHGHLK